MAQSGRRRKRAIVEVDDDDNEPCPNVTPKRNSLANFLVSPNGKQLSLQSQPLPSRSRKSRAITKSPSASPEKSRRKPLFDNEKGKSADLRALFSKAAQKRKTTSNNIPESLDLDDDPISDDDDISYSKSSSTSLFAQKAQKRLKKEGHTSLLSASPPSKRAAPVFLQPSISAKPIQDLRPWAERFAPTNLDELAVHKKKVADVRRWLEGVLAGRLPQSLLVLKGAAGTGKTSTMRLLADALSCELLEWRNPTISGIGITSFSMQFDEFMGRGATFGQLDFETESHEPVSKNGPGGHTGGNEKTRKILLIEEFPNTFMRSSTALQAFRKTILGHLADNTPSIAAYAQHRVKPFVTPAVMVVSETLLTTTSASADSFTAHRLLGPEILSHPGTGLIEFNAVAPTFITKALELVALKEARNSGRKRTPGPQVLKKIGEIGDIRSAISALEFLCLKGDEDADWGSKITFTKPKRGAKQAQVLTKGEEASLELITQRESSLGIFHAIGKVMWNKRDEQPPAANTQEAKAENVPSYLSHTARPHRSQVSVNNLIEEIGTDTSTFISALHENYPLSCNPTGPKDINSSLDYIKDCIEYLSASDILCPTWDSFFGGRGPPSGFVDRGSHVLRQDEMAFQVAVQGLLYSLPWPVKRDFSGAGVRGAEAFKMFFPSTAKLWKAKEEMEGLVDMWSNKLLKGIDSEKSLYTPPETILSFRFSNKFGGENSKPKNFQSCPQQDKNANNTTLFSLGSSARKEMVLERLPYLAQILKAQRSGTRGINFIDFQHLDKIVSFKGEALQLEEDLADTQEEQENRTASTTDEVVKWATDKDLEKIEQPMATTGFSRLINRSSGEVPGAVGQKLYLSDDDIEDDYD